MSDRQNLWSDDYKRNQTRFSAENALILLTIILVIVVGYGVLTQRSYEDRKKAELSTMWRGHVDMGAVKVSNAKTWKEQTYRDETDIYARDVELSTGSTTAMRKNLLPAQRDVRIVEETIPSKAFKEAVAPSSGLRLERQ